MLYPTENIARMGLTAIPMEADTGPIGGDISEFIILAETGESGVYFHKDWLNTDFVTDIDYDQDLQPVVDGSPRSTRGRMKSMIRITAQ